MGKSRKITLSVPTTLGDITLGQYQKYMKVIDENKDDSSSVDFVNKKLIEIFCDVNLNEVDKIPLKEAEKVIEVITKAFEQKDKLIKHFTLREVEFGFIPKLDDISLGEYIDLENTIVDWQQMHKAMSVLYRPVNFKSKDKYTIAPYEPNDEIKEIMKEMPLDAVMSSMVFFYALGKELSIATLNFIEQEMKQGKTSLPKELLDKNGDGINQYMQSLKEMSSNLTELHKSPFSSV
tara:strand:+ start:575 stop:1279 length:705 start_codon:yes stop_codon:yes gene_type:complete